VMTSKTVGRADLLHAVGTVMEAYNLEEMPPNAAADHIVYMAHYIEPPMEPVSLELRKAIAVVREALQGQSPELVWRAVWAVHCYCANPLKSGSIAFDEHKAQAIIWVELPRERTAMAWCGDDKLYRYWVHEDGAVVKDMEQLNVGSWITPGEAALTAAHRFLAVGLFGEHKREGEESK